MSGRGHKKPDDKDTQILKLQSQSSHHYGMSRRKHADNEHLVKVNEKLLEACKAGLDAIHAQLAGKGSIPLSLADIFEDAITSAKENKMDKELIIRVCKVPENKMIGLGDFTISLSGFGINGTKVLKLRLSELVDYEAKVFKFDNAIKFAEAQEIVDK